MRILLADHHPQALWALKTAFQEHAEFEVAGEAVDAAGLLSLADTCTPDLALVDWELPGKSIKVLISELHARTPRPAVVVIGSKPEYGRMLFKAGADAFVSKSDQPDWLFETLKSFLKAAPGDE